MNEGEVLGLDTVAEGVGPAGCVGGLDEATQGVPGGWGQQRAQALAIRRDQRSLSAVSGGGLGLGALLLGELLTHPAGVLHLFLGLAEHPGALDA